MWLPHGIITPETLDIRKLFVKNCQRWELQSWSQNWINSRVRQRLHQLKVFWTFHFTQQVFQIHKCTTLCGQEESCFFYLHFTKKGTETETLNDFLIDNKCRGTDTKIHVLSFNTWRFFPAFHSLAPVTFFFSSRRNYSTWVIGSYS